MYWSSERLRYEASLRRPRASNPPACNRGAVLNRQRESCRKLLHRTLSLPALVATHRAAAYNINITRVRNTIQMYTLHAVLGAPTKQPPRLVRTPILAALLKYRHADVTFLVDSKSEAGIRLSGLRILVEGLSSREIKTTVSAIFPR